MKRSGKPRILKGIEISHAGKQHAGSFEIEGKTVKVTSIYGSKVTQAGGSPPEALAKIMLTELVKERSA